MLQPSTSFPFRSLTYKSTNIIHSLCRILFESRSYKSRVSCHLWNLNSWDERQTIQYTRNFVEKTHTFFLARYYRKMKYVMVSPEICLFNVRLPFLCLSPIPPQLSTRIHYPSFGYSQRETRNRYCQETCTNYVWSQVSANSLYKVH